MCNASVRTYLTMLSAALASGCTIIPVHNVKIDLLCHTNKWDNGVHIEHMKCNKRQQIYFEVKF